MLDLHAMIFDDLDSRFAELLLELCVPYSELKPHDAGLRIHRQDFRQMILEMVRPPKNNNHADRALELVEPGNDTLSPERFPAELRIDGQNLISLLEEIGRHLIRGTARIFVGAEHRNGSNV